MSYPFTRFHLFPALLIVTICTGAFADEAAQVETEDKATREKMYRLNAEKYKSKTAKRATRALHPYLLLGEAVVWQSGPEGGERAMRAAGHYRAHRSSQESRWLRAARQKQSQKFSQRTRVFIVRDGHSGR
jgi:hypothetical protein